MKLFCITLTFFLLTFQYAFSQDQQPAETEQNSAQQEPEKQLEGTGRITVTQSQDTLTIGIPFTLTILVDYPDPEEVTVTTPNFSGNLTLNLFVKSPVVTDTNQTQQSNRRGRNTEEKVHTQTALEFRLTPNNVGRITMDPFTIISPHGARITSPIVLFVNNRTEAQRINSQRLVWEGAPRQAAPGERVTFYLRLQNITSINAENIPPSSFFMPQVPQGVILSHSPVTPEEKESGIVLKLTLIPLAEGSLNIPARNFNNANVRYDIPALNIRITAR